MTTENREEHTGLGRETSPNAYCSKITLACDTGKLSYDPATGSAKILCDATVPPRLASYARENGHEMPEGLYGFFGEQASANLKVEVLEHLKHREKGDGFLWDLQATLVFERAASDSKVPTSLVWKDPGYLQASFIRVGKLSKDVADLLRYFTGDQHALDRLTLEPWRIDTYVAVLNEAYGPMRAVVFDAMMDDGSIVPIVRIYDPELISSSGITPLYHYLSSKDPEQPKSYQPPAADWAGWGVKPKVLTPLDRADIIAFQNVPRSHVKEREALRMRRIRSLRQEGRFSPREADLKEIVERRLEGTRASSPALVAKERKGKAGGSSGGNTSSSGSSVAV